MREKIVISLVIAGGIGLCIAYPVVMLTIVGALIDAFTEIEVLTWD